MRQIFLVTLLILICAGIASSRIPIASLNLNDPRAGIWVNVQQGEVLKVTAQLSPGTEVLAYDGNNHFSDLGKIRKSGESIIITNQTNVDIRAWRGADINPGPGGGFKNDMYNIDVKNDYQKIGVREGGNNVVIIELQLLH